MSIVDIHFPGDPTAQLAWCRLVELKKALNEGGHRAAGHFRPYSSRREVNNDLAATRILAGLLADVSQAGPVSEFFFLTEAEEMTKREG